jgi:hypothetical protein
MQQTNFSDSFIKGMLGWIRWIASSIANLFQSGGQSSGDMSMISWFADNWIKILIGLIVVGVLADWLVWMARWRPYWVWFSKRRLLLDKDVDGIDDDDLMLHYSDMAPARARRDRADESLDLDDFDDIRRSGYDPDDFDEEDGEYEDDEDADYEDDEDSKRAGRYDEDEDGEDEDGEGEDDPRRDELNFDELYDDQYGDYGRPNRASEEPEDGKAVAEEIALGEREEVSLTRSRARKTPRENVMRRGLFNRPRKKADEEDPFSVEGDFFDDLGEDPMDDIVSTRVKLNPEQRDAQDTSVYQRPKLLPGDEPGAVRGADEDEGWHSGYTQRSVERGKRRKRDAGA